MKHKRPKKYADVPEGHIAQLISRIMMDTLKDGRKRRALFKHLSVSQINHLVYWEDVIQRDGWGKR